MNCRRLHTVHRPLLALCYREQSSEAEEGLRRHEQQEELQQCVQEGQRRASSIRPPLPTGQTRTDCLIEDRASLMRCANKS